MLRSESGWHVRAALGKDAARPPGRRGALRLQRRCRSQRWKVKKNNQLSHE